MNLVEVIHDGKKIIGFLETNGRKWHFCKGSPWDDCCETWECSSFDKAIDKAAEILLADRSFNIAG